MSLYDTWNAAVENNAAGPQAETFWRGYLAKEAGIYETLLSEKQNKIEGTLAELAETHGVEPVTFVGFLDGVNTSLEEELDLESLTEASTIDATIDFEKLYFNMLDAKADWLYEIEAWDEILTEEKRKEIKKAYGDSKTIVKEEKPGPNEPCHCGSGKKYKKCCMKKDLEAERA